MYRATVEEGWGERADPRAAKRPGNTKEQEVKTRKILMAGLIGGGLALWGSGTASASGICSLNCDETFNDPGIVITGPGQNAVVARAIVNVVGNRPSPAAGIRSAPTGVTGTPTQVVSADGTTFNVQTGLGAGDGGGGVALWGAASYGYTANTMVETKYYGNVGTFSLGADYALNDVFVVGVAGTFDSADITTQFNRGNSTTAGFTVTPYVLAMITDSLSLDLTAGYGRTETDSDRFLTGTWVTGKTHGERALFAANLNQYYVVGDWNLNAKISYIYARETSDGFTESNNAVQNASTSNLGEIRVGGRAGYLWNQFEPYAALEYVYDHIMSDLTTAANQRNPANDDDEVFGAIGLNYYHSDSVSASAELSNSFGRKQIRNTAFMMNARFQF